MQIWVGGPSTAGLDLTTACGGPCKPGDLGSNAAGTLGALGFVPLSVFENVSTATAMNSVSTSISGRYVLIAGQRGEYDDYFKVDAARATEATTVPEPSSLSLLLGAGLLGALVYRRRRSARTAARAAA